MGAFPWKFDEWFYGFFRKISLVEVRWSWCFTCRAGNIQLETRFQWSKFVDKHTRLASVRMYCFPMVALSLRYTFHIVLWAFAIFWFKKTREMSGLFLKEERWNPSISIGTYALKSPFLSHKKTKQRICSIKRIPKINSDAKNTCIFIISFLAWSSYFKSLVELIPI